MTKLQWDQTDERPYESGIDRGVLYLSDNSGVPWNGLTSIEEDFTDDKTTPTYIDGIKYASNPSSGDFAASLKAFTYPDEFLEFDGTISIGEGLLVDGQNSEVFGLSYRTLIGDENENSANYKIHILYNLTSVPDDRDYDTIDDQINPIEFGWKISGVPEKLEGYKPTAHVIIDTSYLDWIETQSIESILYGSEEDEARLPSIFELKSSIAF